MDDPTKTYHIWTIGCQMNEADSQRLAARLEELGYSPAEGDRHADVIVLNTCVIRQQAEDKIYEKLRPLQGVKRRKPRTTVAVMGCLVGRNEEPALRERFPFVDVFMRPSDIRPLAEHLEARETRAEERTRRDALQDEGLAIPRSEQGTAVTAFVPIVLGCSHACTFCVIPYRRGAEESRPKETILSDVRTLAAQGIREVTLLGQIVDRYGLDSEPRHDLSDLLAAVSEIDGIDRIRFLTSHPNWFTDRLLDAMASLPKVCPCIELPVQAGNDEVLANMKRGYTAADYRRLIDRIRSRIPGIAINTDIIVGFPGETEEQFMDSYRLMADLQFDMAHIAKYSERPMTVAARRFPDNVAEPEKERRRLVLEDMLDAQLAEKHRALEGSVVAVLAESRGRNGRWRGRTPQNTLVFFDDERGVRGKIVDVRIGYGGPFTMTGKALDGGQPR